MSIIISNISESKGIEYLPHGEVGVQVYQIYLNNIPLAEFEHNTECGMAECLVLAGNALKGVCIDTKIEEYRAIRLNSVLGLLRS